MNVFAKLRGIGRKHRRGRDRRRRLGRRARGLEVETLPGGDSAREAERASPERAAELAD